MCTTTNASETCQGVLDPVFVEMSAAQATADVVYSWNSTLILSITNISTRNPQLINATGLFAGLEYMFGPRNTTQYNPASEVAELVYVLYNALQGIVPVQNDNSGSSDGYVALLNILATVLLIVQPTSLLQDSFDNQPQPGLPPEFYISVELTETFPSVFVPRWAVILYTVVSSVIFLACVLGIILASLVPGPQITSFPVVDFSSRLDINANDVFAGLSTGKDADVRLKLADKSLVLKLIETGANMGTDSDILQRKLGFMISDKEVSK